MTPGNFRIFSDRQCKECGRTWTPACTRRAARWLVTLGAVLLAAAGGIVLAAVCFDGVDKGLVGGLMLGSFPGLGGVCAFYYGVGTLCGWLGRLKMR